MKIGILKCDTAMLNVLKKYGDYDKIILDFLRLSNNNITMKSFDCINGELPNDSDFNTCHGFIVSGSRYSVYDDYDWIFDLKIKIREMDRLNIKMIGICFGHQLIINALGGKVEPNVKGWEVSVNPIYDTEENLLFYINQMHKDIVTQIPNNFIETFYNDNSRYQGCFKENILTLQGHPEYNSFIIKQFLEKRKDIMGHDVVQEGLIKLNNQTNNIHFSNLFYEFLMM